MPGGSTFADEIINLIPENRSAVKYAVIELMPYAEELKNKTPLGASSRLRNEIEKENTTNTGINNAYQQGVGICKDILNTFAKSAQQAYSQRYTDIKEQLFRNRSDHSINKDDYLEELTADYKSIALLAKARRFCDNNYKEKNNTSLTIEEVIAQFPQEIKQRINDKFSDFSPMEQARLKDAFHNEVRNTLIAKYGSDNTTGIMNEMENKLRGTLGEAVVGANQARQNQAKNSQIKETNLIGEKQSQRQEL